VTSSTTGKTAARFPFRTTQLAWYHRANTDNEINNH
jgi:hypothetical protein